MSAAPSKQSVPADQEARDRILTDLDTNLLVEAGAGSGKTTSLVGRMLALVARGTPVDRIAAVTFTRKAANELRERFQLGLEERIRNGASDDEATKRYDAALRDLDSAFLGTIHAFCARLLRERPLEAGIDPNFQEVTEEDWTELQLDFWNRWLERLKGDGDPSLAALGSIGVDARTLHQGFCKVVLYPDVDFPLGDSVAPDVSNCRRALEKLLARAEAMLPKSEPADGWDPLMKLVRRLSVQRRIHDWSDVASFCAAIESLKASACQPTQKRWGADKESKAAAKALGEDFASFMEDIAADVLRCWREHRYPIVMRFLGRAAEEFQRERLATAQLGFSDLLMLAATLLRENPDARDQLGARYAHLLVDEFQDTDPVQAEVCMLLASPSSEGNDWRTVRPRAGGVFVVGDPKQSIYRFRRADIQVYELVKRRFDELGDVLALTQNFRSTEPIEQLVNGHFGNVFPAEGTPMQAPFSAMKTDRPGLPPDGVFQYTVCPDARRKDAIFARDAEMLGSWIAARIAKGERVAGDFLILTDTRKPIAYYARALAERNVPVSTTGAALPQEVELTELLVVLRTIADPENGVLVAAALEGLFFGLTPADLYAARVAGLHFSITHRPAEDASAVGRALLQLHEWWRISQRQAADVLLERILDDTGLLFLAASEPLGDARAGALLHLVEALRAASTLGASGVSAAMERLEILLAREAPDAPLRPGRTDAVRVMNLHKAKGLEATVVVLAAPDERKVFAPDVYVRRDEKGTHGALVISFGEIVIAQPPGWSAMEADEALFDSAEDDRLLYVATTRPKCELVVARCEHYTKVRGTEYKGWAYGPLKTMLDAVASELEMKVTEAPGRARVRHSAEEMRTAVSVAASRVAAASVASMRVETVTESAKEQRDVAREYDLPVKRGLGPAWGRAVHRALEAAGQGRDGEALEFLVRAIAADEGLDEERATALGRIVAQVRASDAWKQLLGGKAVFELPVMQVRREGDVELVTEGVMDAAVLGDDGWLVLDWKTDDVADAEWEKRRIGYERQVGRYAEMLTALGGRTSAGEIIRVR
jgi:ATP-dependent helicase/nuclease subunit A